LSEGFTVHAVYTRLRALPLKFSPVTTDMSLRFQILKAHMKSVRRAYKDFSA
jgi:hypothetical protein